MKSTLSSPLTPYVWQKATRSPFRMALIFLPITLISTGHCLSIPAGWLDLFGTLLQRPASGIVAMTVNWVESPHFADSLLVASLVQGSHWAELSVMILLMLLAGTTYQHQRTRQKQMDSIRNQIAADLHDEIGSSLSSIGLLGALARNGLSNPHKAACLLNQLVEETRQVSNALDDVVWSVSPRDEQSALLGSRMYRYAANLFENAGIVYRINIPDEALLTRVPTEQQRDLYFFFKEGINNLIKHAGAMSATVTLSPQKDGLYLTITDNGRGFDPSGQTVRNGLRNLNLRATALRGRLSIRSAPNKGTTIGLWFPLPSR